MLSTGTFERALDSKLRVLLPKPVRQSLRDSDPLYATPGTEGCLELHSQSSIQQLAALAIHSGGRTGTGKAFGRLFYSQAEMVEIDKQGRIRLPPRLATWAELENQIALIGVGSHWEIWNLRNWQTYFEQNQTEFDVIHQNTFEIKPEKTDNQAPVESHTATSRVDSSNPNTPAGVPSQHTKTQRKPK